MSITLAPSHLGIITCDRKPEPNIHPRKRKKSLATYYTEKGAKPEIFRGIGADYWGTFEFDGKFQGSEINFVKKYLKNKRDALKDEIIYKGTKYPSYFPKIVGDWSCKNQKGGFVIAPNENFKKIDLRNNKLTQEAIFNFLIRDELKTLNREVTFYISETSFLIYTTPDTIE